MSLNSDKKKEIFEKTANFIDKNAKLAEVLIEHIDTLGPVVELISGNPNDEKLKTVTENARNELKMLAQELTKAKQNNENTDLQMLMTDFDKKTNKILLLLQEICNIFQKYLPKAKDYIKAQQNIMNIHLQMLTTATDFDKKTEKIQKLLQ